MAEEKPFDGLTVNFHWSERQLLDPDGKPYEEDTALKGEDAYLFLVQLNRADKEAFEHRVLGRGGYDKTSLDVHIPGFGMKDMRVDLGDLELLGAKSVTEALEARLPAHSKYLLKHPDSLEAEGVSVEDCKEIISEFEKAIPAFQKQEAAYLATHPDIQAINETPLASAYHYVATPETFNLCKDRELVLQSSSSEDLTGYVILPDIYPESDPYHHRSEYLSQISLSNIEDAEIVVPPKAELVVFSSYADPEHISHALSDAGRFHLRPVITPDEVEAIKEAAGSIKLREWTAPFDSREEDHETLHWDEPQVYTGVYAIHNFIRNHVENNKKGDPCFPSYHDIRLQTGSFVFKTAYKDGSGKVAEELQGKFLPKIPSAIEKTLKTAWAVFNKYGGHPYMDDIFCDKVSSPVGERYATQEDFERAFHHFYGHATKFPDEYGKGEAAEFYLNYASIDQENNTPRKVIRSALQHMAEDGISKRTAKAIMKRSYTHPSYYEDICGELLSKDKELANAFKNAKNRATTK